MLLLSIVLSYAGLAVAGKLDIVYQWKYIDYVWDNNAQRQDAINNGTYNHTNIFTIDVEISPGAIFVTTPKQTGVPASLSIVANQTGPGGPLLKPFPDWSWHTRTDCGGITSVWRVAVDKCNRLWVLDSGKVNDVQICPAQLLSFDVNSYKLLSRFQIPESLLYDAKTNGTGLLVTPVVETKELNCTKTWVYMADVTGYGLLVWHKNNIWRLNSSLYAANPKATRFTVAGESFEISDGVVGLALSPSSKTMPNRKLFFKPLASYDVYSVSVNDLHESLRRNVSYQENEYKLPSQSVAQAFSKDGTLFFGLTSKIAIACWNIHKPFNASNVIIVARNNDTLQFASGVKVQRNFDGQNSKEHLWIMTNRFQKIMAGTQNFEEINYRVLKGSVAKLTQGTNCHP